MLPTRTRGIILRVNDYGESDKLVTFFSPDIGKATAIAKGAKRSRHRFVNKLELFTQLLLTFHRPNRRQGGLLFLSEAETDNTFPALRQKHKLYLTAVYIGELVLRFTREYDREPQLFALLRETYHWLDQGRAPLATAALFHIKLLEVVGYRPNLEQCGMCGVTIRTDMTFFTRPENGMLICEECRRKLGVSIHPPLAVRTLKILQQAQSLEISHLQRLRFPESAAREALFMLYRYSRYILQQDVNSWNCLVEV